MVLNRCHVAFRPPTSSEDHGDQMIIFTEKGRRRAEDVIRRHRLAEVLFTHTFQVEDEKEIAEQACRFEHILSPEATDRICTFLGHPRTCPHGSLIPAGPCCLAAAGTAARSLPSPACKLALKNQKGEAVLLSSQLAGQSVHALCRQKLPDDFSRQSNLRTV